MGLLDILGLGGGNGAAAPGAPAGGAPAGDQGGFLNMLGLNDPEKRSRLGQGLIALGGSMMKAGGPSYTPNNFLGALGEGMNSFAKSYGSTGDDALKRLYTKAQIGNLTANTSLHGLQAQQLQAQQAARAAFNGTVNPNGSGSIAINTSPGVAIPGAPTAGTPPLGTPAVPGQEPAPTSQPLNIVPPAQQAAQGALAQAKPPIAAPGTAPAAPQAPGVPAVAPGAPAVAPGAQAPASPAMDTGTVLMARIKQLNEQSRQARAAGYDALATQYGEQALAMEKHAFNNGQVLMPDGTLKGAPGYAAAKGQVAQSESAGKSAGELPSKLVLQGNESDLRMKEQAAKDQSGDKKTFDDRAREMNNSWVQNAFNQKFQTVSTIRSGLDRAVKDPSGLGGFQLALDLYKVVDPGSVVSGNEIATVNNVSQSMPEQYATIFRQMASGAGTSEEARTKFAKFIDGKYQDMRKTYETQRDNQRALAGKIGGIDPTKVMPDVAELHSPWKSTAELERERNAAAAAGAMPGLGGAPAAPAGAPAGALATPRTGGVPKFSSPNDPGFAALKPGDRFEYNGQIFQKN